MQIRRAGPDDRDAVTAVYLRSRAGAGDFIPPGIHPEYEVREHVADHLIPACETWLAELDGTAVGVLVLDGADLDWLSVIPEAQGSGVGTTLLGHARLRRPDGLQLWVFTSNVAARNFYERHGFRLAYETDGARNEERAPDMRYVWP